MNTLTEKSKSRFSPNSAKRELRKPVLQKTMYDTQQINTLDTYSEDENEDFENVKMAFREKETIQQTEVTAFLKNLMIEFKIRENLHEIFDEMKKEKSLRYWIVEESQLIVTKIKMVKTKKGKYETISLKLCQGEATLDKNVAIILKKFKSANELIPKEYQSIIDGFFYRIEEPVLPK